MASNVGFLLQPILFMIPNPGSCNMRISPSVDIVTYAAISYITYIGNFSEYGTWFIILPILAICW